MSTPSDKEFEQKRAVVDIGSNSVRLVIYEGSERAPIQICNEKALCGLGRDMPDGGALNPDAVRMALTTLRRFRFILDEHGDPKTTVLATAAVREAVDGQAFVREANRLGFAVDVIGGAREATLAALGVICYNPQANGLVGDMGGGSLELVRISQSRIHERSSLSIGPLRLIKHTGGDISKASPLIDQALNEANWVSEINGGALFAVGGAWRAVARIHMGLRGYPLPILHQYEMARRDADEICHLISTQSRRSLEEIPGLPRRRIETLPFASLVLRNVLERMNADRLVVSAGGVREGVLYEQMDDETRQIDPLAASASFFARRLSPDPTVGEAAMPMTAGLFPDETPAEARIRAAACILIDAAAFYHPDHRGEQAFDMALRAPFYAISHRERVALAFALYVRHEGRSSNYADSQRKALNALDWDAQQRAVQIGLALRFAGALAPKAPGLLAGCRLSRAGGEVRFEAPPGMAALMEDLPRRRLAALASAFEADPVFSFEPAPAR